ncbi:hypothetical protein GU926_08390 [Nibribacter ruber]|uniref:Uncharacterized protein n=1 Tax=Nibribacter ruber TaxID=2698458 RepID=A0A6P1NZA0_9BACT|nr:hypothetical protein [Nibribacter ruber]QHL87455.1 hypothetical protein GU926_08390 [Nibribacter ruber]
METEVDSRILSFMDKGALRYDVFDTASSDSSLNLQTLSDDFFPLDYIEKSEKHFSYYYSLRASGGLVVLRITIKDGVMKALLAPHSHFSELKPQVKFNA